MFSHQIDPIATTLGAWEYPWARDALSFNRQPERERTDSLH